MTSRVSEADTLRSRADRRTTLALVCAVVFFVVSGYVAYRNIGTIRDDNQKVIQSQETVTALSAVLSSTQDAETGQRGYLLTGNERYLEPYNAALASIPARLDSIRHAVRDNTVQQQRLAELTARVGEKLAELKETIDLRRTHGIDPALVVVNSDRGKAAMDAIRTQLVGMQGEELALRDKRVAEMTSAYGNALTSAILSALLGVGLTVFIGVMLRNATKVRRRSAWLQSGQLELANAMAGDQETKELGANILAFLARYLDAQAGALFVRDTRGFARTSAYGLASGETIVERFEAAEGLLGQAASERRMLVVNDVPDGYLSVGSALGQDKPRHIVILPSTTDGAVNGVLELGFFRPVGEDALALLEEGAPAIGLALRSATYRADLSRLLEETQRQSESLQTQSEELRVSNEELEEQSRALKQSQHELEQQQVELEQTNAHLEEQAQQLEKQRDDLVRANELVESKAEEVQRASRYKSDFLANMSHELRTPLNSSLILSKLLADNPRGNLTEEQIKFANTIHSSGNDLLTLINDILDLSKIEAGHIEVHAEPLTIERVVGGLLPMFQPIAEQRGLGFEISVSNDCPAVMETDRQRLEQVLKNLLSNAFKFTETGSVKLGVSQDAGGNIVFAVTDTGIGIEPEQQKRIFDAFQQADGTISRKYGGTGLGLSISVELARLLGGHIDVQSQVGKGSTFSLSLPPEFKGASTTTRATAPTSAPVVSQAPVAQPTRAVTALPAKVPDDREDVADHRRVLLVIEDDETFAQILRDLAREMHFRCLIATTAHEALALAKMHLPHAIVLDVGLPDQSGLSVLDLLKRDVRTRHIPIHMVSATDHSHTALSMGAVGYLLKPVKRQELADALTRLDARLSQAMRRVLIVEDDEVQRDAIGRLLASADVETVGAGTAARMPRAPAQ